MVKTIIILFELALVFLTNCANDSIPINSLAETNCELLKIYYTIGNSIVSKSVDFDTEKTEFLASPNCTIIDFCLLQNFNFFIAIKDMGEYSCKVTYYDRKKDQSYFVDSLSNFNRIKLITSPISNLVAVLLSNEGTISISKLDPTINHTKPLVFCTFQNPYYGYDVNIYWARNDESIIAESFFHLFQIDLQHHTYRLLETPNITDVIDYEYLLRQGFSLDIPTVQYSSPNTFIRKKCSPSANSYVAIRNDSLFLMNTNRNISKLLYDNCSDNLFSFNPIWDHSSGEPISTINNRRLFIVDSAWIAKVIPDNQFIKFNISKIDNIIPTLSLSYTHTDYILDYKHFIFFDSLTTEMLKIVEMDYVLFYWGLLSIPRTSPWNYYGQSDFKESCSAFTSIYSNFVDKVTQLNIYHPDSTILNDFKVKVKRNRDFYLAFFELMELNDINTFNNKMHTLFSNNELTNINKYVNILTCDTLYNRFSTFHDSVYNNLLNVYGINTHPKIESLLIKNNIVRIPTWFLSL